MRTTPLTALIRFSRTYRPEDLVQIRYISYLLLVAVDLQRHRLRLLTGSYGAGVVAILLAVLLLIALAMAAEVGNLVYSSVPRTRQWPCPTGTGTGGSKPWQLEPS